MARNNFLHAACIHGGWKYRTLPIYSMHDSYSGAVRKTYGRTIIIYVANVLLVYVGLAQARPNDVHGCMCL